MALFNLGGPEATAGIIEGCYSLSEVPGRKITKALGLVEYTVKGIAGDAPNASEGIFKALLSVAKKLGANAVVNVRLAIGPYQQQGSGWQVTYVIAYGDAVVLSNVNLSKPLGR